VKGFDNSGRFEDGFFPAFIILNIIAAIVVWLAKK
jgi:ABC-type multidrug transport system permease subunit